MDTNAIFLFLIGAIALIIISETSEAILLFIFGFFLAAFAWNINTIFSISETTYDNWGRLFIYSYWGLVIFTFAKSSVSGTVIIKRKNA